MKYFFTGLIVVLFIKPVFSQFQATKWYFGWNAALDFMTSPPTILTNNAMTPVAMGFFEGVSSIADPAGNLLFYTDGVNVFNQNHVMMANGFGLLGSPTSCQSALIVKQPGNANIYFIFTTERALTPTTFTYGLRYSVVDMSLAAGMGSVTIKNTLLYYPTTERLCATRHCNGSDIWVLSHGYGGTIGQDFYAHLVTASGVNATPVISTLGFSVDVPHSGQSSMKFSPEGKKVMTGCYTKGFELYDFDNVTGVVSNALHLVGRNAQHVEFSPDGSKCYGISNDTIKQWDLCGGTANSILTSKNILKIPAYASQIQQAPDGKIYVSIANSQTLGVINNPNALGSAGYNYVHLGQSVAPNSASYGFPQFISTYFLKIPPFTFTNNPAVGCLTAAFNAPVNPTCPQAGYSISNQSWDFGDPASGANNSSILNNPTHIYTAPGVYTVQLILYSTCGGVLDTLKQQINISSLPLISNAGFSICAGESLTLTTSGATSYTWSTGATSSSIVITPASNTVISISGTNSLNCAASAIQSITVFQASLTINGPTVICDGSVTTLTASGASTYTWNNGITTATMSLGTTGAGNYTIVGTNSFGCVNQQTVSLNVSPVPTINITGNTTVCEGSAVTQTASGAATYSWDTGATTQTVSLTPLQNTSYIVYGTNAAGCTSQQTVDLFVVPIPTLSITGNTLLCPGGSVTQTVTGANTYTWSNGASSNTVSLSPQQSTLYTVSGVGNNLCVATSTVFILVNSVSVNDATICSGQSALLIGQSAVPGYSYTWFPGSSNAMSIIVFPLSTQVYTLVASLPNCTTSTTGTVNVIFSAPAITNFSYTSPVCSGSVYLLPDTEAGFTPNGVFSSTNALAIDNSNGVIVSQLDPGEYFITYSVSADGCALPGISSFTLVVVPQPELIISPDVVITPGSSVSLNVSGGGAYAWTSSTDLSCSDCKDPVAAPLENTRYCVTTSVDGCESTACVNVIVSCETGNNFSIPNAFSPNNDGNNDEFCLKGWTYCVSDFNVMIFDRWGEKVFESDDPSFCWDGTYNGKLLNADVFVCVIKAQAKTAKINKKGNITLIR